MIGKQIGRKGQKHVFIKVKVQHWRWVFGLRLKTPNDSEVLAPPLRCQAWEESGFKSSLCLERWWDQSNSARKAYRVGCSAKCDILNLMQAGTGSQLRDCSNGMVWESLGRLKTSRVLAFWISWRCEWCAEEDLLEVMDSNLVLRQQETEHVPELSVWREMDKSFWC